MRLQFITSFEVYPQATRQHTIKISSAIVSYSFVTYPTSACVTFFDLTGFWLQTKMLHFSGLFLLPSCYNQPFWDKYLFSRTLNLFPSSQDQNLVYFVHFSIYDVTDKHNVNYYSSTTSAVWIQPRDFQSVLRGTQRNRDQVPEDPCLHFYV